MRASVGRHPPSWAPLGARRPPAGSGPGRWPGIRTQFSSRRVSLRRLPASSRSRVRNRVLQNKSHISWSPTGGVALHSHACDRARGRGGGDRSPATPCARFAATSAATAVGRRCAPWEGPHRAIRTRCHRGSSVRPPSLAGALKGPPAAIAKPSSSSDDRPHRCAHVVCASLHHAPIFRLLQEVAVNGAHRCDSPICAESHVAQDRAWWNEQEIKFVARVIRK